MADTVRIGLDGFGRIGRTVFCAALRDNRVEIVGSNDAIDDESVAYLAKYDTVTGTLDAGDRSPSPVNSGAHAVGLGVADRCRAARENGRRSRC